jgi:hypothetical protein
VEGVAGWIARHHVMTNVRIDDIGNGIVNIEEGNILDQGKSIGFLGNRPFSNS